MYNCCPLEPKKLRLSENNDSAKATHSGLRICTTARPWGCLFLDRLVHALLALPLGSPETPSQPQAEACHLGVRALPCGRSAPQGSWHFREHSPWLRRHCTTVCLLVRWSRDITHVEAGACQYLACPRDQQLREPQSTHAHPQPSRSPAPAP